MKEYNQRVLEHHRRIPIAEHKLIETLQLLCPGYWVLNITATKESGKMKNGKFEKFDYPRPMWLVSVGNGDDNVTAIEGTIGEAAAMVIKYLLGGAVFPLGGEGGRYIAQQDRGDYE